MTDLTTTGRKTTHTLTAALALLLPIGLTACEAFVGAGPTPYSTEGPDDTGKPDAGSATPKAAGNTAGSGKANNAPAQAGSSATANNKPTNPTPPNMPASPCDTAPEKAKAVLSSYCGSCHSNPATAQAGFSTVLDAPALLASGKVVSGQPAMSPLWKRMQANTMPPASVQKRPADAELAAVKDWIDCGARDWNSPVPPQAFLGIDQRSRLLLDDVRSVPNPIDRERIRYLDLSSLANAGATPDQLDLYREAISFLLNSLSRGRSVVAPVPIDDAKLLYRIDLRDYLWDQSTWAQLESIYPYAVIYNQDSRLYPFDEETSAQVRRETRSQIPSIQGDWFISHASRPPLYFTLLDLPDNLDGLARQLGVDIQRNIDTEQVMRSGFANAGPSQNNRVIERHELGGNRGALWLSYDFASNLDTKNIFAHPLDFEADGGEMIFNLDNGLQGYFVADAAGRRLDKAPNGVVQDPASRDGAVETGLSCMNCHQQDGQLPKYDEIRSFALNAGANAREIDKVLALYVQADELMAAFDEDQNRYRTARTALGVRKLTNTTLHELDDRHLGILDLDAVASVIGLPALELKRSIDASPQALPPEIVTLRSKGGGIQRDSFESIVGALVEGLGLGRQLRVDGRADEREDRDEDVVDPGAAGSSAPPAETPDAGTRTDDNRAGSGGSSSSSASPDAGTGTPRKRHN